MNTCSCGCYFQVNLTAHFVLQNYTFFIKEQIFLAVFYSVYSFYYKITRESAALEQILSSLSSKSNIMSGKQLFIL